MEYQRATQQLALLLCAYTQLTSDEPTFIIATIPVYDDGPSCLQTMSWVLESGGQAIAGKDFESMHVPVVELMTKEDLALALKYLNPSLTQEDTKTLFDHGT